jgi:Resolvase, N terminal domain
MLGMFAEFERAMIQERVRAGLARARAQGKRLGCLKVTVSLCQFGAFSGQLLRGRDRTWRAMSRRSNNSDTIWTEQCDNKAKQVPWDHSSLIGDVLLARSGG